MCRLDDAETRLLAGHLEIPVLVGRDLQEHAVVWPALVGLSGRMQEARAELGAGSEMLLVTHRMPHLLQRVDMRTVALDIGQQRDIVAAAGAREMRRDPGVEIAIGAGLAQFCRVLRVGVEIGLCRGYDRRFRRQLSGLLEGVGQFPCLYLCRFHVGLVERVDAEDRAGNRGRNFEAEEFLADMAD